MYRLTISIEVPDEIVHQRELWEWEEWLEERCWYDPEEDGHLSFSKVAEILAYRELTWGLPSSVTFGYGQLKLVDAMEYLNVEGLTRPLRMQPAEGK